MEQVVYHNSAQWCGYRETSTRRQLKDDLQDVFAARNVDADKNSLGVDDLFEEDKWQKSKDKNRVTFIWLDADEAFCCYDHILKSDLVSMGLSKEHHTDWDEFSSDIRAEYNKGKGKNVSTSCHNSQATPPIVQRSNTIRRVKIVEDLHQRYSHIASLLDASNDFSCERSTYQGAAQTQLPVRPTRSIRRADIRLELPSRPSAPWADLELRPSASPNRTGSSAFFSRGPSVKQPYPQRLTEPIPWLAPPERSVAPNIRRLASLSQGIHIQHTSFHLERSVSYQTSTDPLVEWPLRRSRTYESPPPVRGIRLMRKAGDFVKSLKRWASSKKHIT